MPSPSGAFLHLLLFIPYLSNVDNFNFASAFRQCHFERCHCSFYHAFCLVVRVGINQVVQHKLISKGVRFLFTVHYYAI
uniref:Putative secreted protein n=1 Tax=Xenopsylla cheopis TaxID=163159 RepID=A0A6M2DXY1_XENCH